MAYFSVDVVLKLKQENVPVFALETVPESKLIFTPGLFPATGCALILGNERFGIEANILKVMGMVVISNR
jgi:tRNA G18 (ribose-2'-O)-methylase SpoU